MSEHIQIEAVGLPFDSTRTAVQELKAPNLQENEQPFQQYVHKSWSGKASALHFYKSGLIKFSSNKKNAPPILIRPGILDSKPLTQYHTPYGFVLIAIAAVIASGVLYYLSLFNEWMFGFYILLALG